MIITSGGAMATVIRAELPWLMVILLDMLSTHKLMDLKGSSLCPVVSTTGPVWRNYLQISYR